MQDMVVAIFEELVNEVMVKVTLEGDQNTEGEDE